MGIRAQLQLVTVGQSHEGLEVVLSSTLRQLSPQRRLYAPVSPEGAMHLPEVVSETNLSKRKRQTAGILSRDDARHTSCHNVLQGAGKRILRCQAVIDCYTVSNSYFHKTICLRLTEHTAVDLPRKSLHSVPLLVYASKIIPALTKSVSTSFGTTGVVVAYRRECTRYSAFHPSLADNMASHLPECLAEQNSYQNCSCDHHFRDSLSFSPASCIASSLLASPSWQRSTRH